MADSGTMRACWYSSYGPAAQVLEVGILPVPDPRAGEVRVRIHLSAVNPGDTKARRGMRGPLPFDRVVPHSAGSGVVESVGPGVEPDWVGRRVWIHGAGYGRPWGTAAEYSVVPIDLAVPLPEGATFRDGACLGIPAMTSHRCVFGDGPVAGKKVLVVGASGSVGSYAVQLAVWGGAAVYAVTGSDHVESVAALGAEAVFPREDPALEAAIAADAGERGIDRIVAADFDLALRLAPPLLAPSGVITSYAVPESGTPTMPFRDLMLRNATIDLVYLFGVSAEAKRRATADITAALQETGLSCPVAGVFPLDEAAAAHDIVEQPTTRGVALVDPT
jgi:NADPH2:quinone reductase